MPDAPARGGARVGRSRPVGAVRDGALELLAVPALATVQDLGRPAAGADGVPVSGAVDWLSLAAVNRLVGNAAGDAALEWAGGALRLRARAPLTVAVGGARAAVALDGRPAPWAEPLPVPPGAVLEIAPAHEGRWNYLAVAGGLAVPPVLGARATYLPAALGGLEGRPLARGDRLPVGTLTSRAAPPAARAALRALMAAMLARDAIGFVPTALAERLPGGAAAIATRAFRVQPASDRMGTRLTTEPAGAAPRLPAALAALPSEPTTVGLLQLPPGGDPIVLMPDGPTVGGYPVLGVVALADLPALAQRPPGSLVRLTLTTPADAARALRARWAALEPDDARTA